MFNFLKKIFDYNEKEIRRIKKIVERINDLEDKVRVLKDKEFHKETEKLKEEVQEKKRSLDEVLPWAFALVREASRRVLNQRHFDVQLMAGVVLHEGKIAEQKTGEGKTLSATTALYLNALTGKPVHLVTVNDYLARRDCGWMGGVFYFLGLKTAAIIPEKSFIFDPNFKDSSSLDWRLKHLRPITRKEAYLADIVYGVNSEFGFDYLRDNMTMDVDSIVQRGFYYAIIDEADSVLIDEARTPHIISAPYEEDVSRYYQFAKIVNYLEEKKDYLVDEKLRTANLTEAGIAKVERILGIENIYEKDYDTLFHIEAALKAKTLFKKDRDYVVLNNEVVIVDEFTGRLLEGRRFSEGIHQAIEAKERVPIKQESKTLATISLQNYFRMYEKLAGMTGTAATEAEEFYKIYKVSVVVIPTHRKMIRVDHPDVIYKTEKTKFNAVIDEIIKNYKIGRPVLVGTTSIEKNEYLSNLLKKRGIPHQILNAKHHEKEAAIIAQAGKIGAITVATNMAGRGVDIILGGQPPEIYSEDKNKDKELKEKLKIWEKEHNQVVKLGGLYVVGTEKHESRRIDNQLRGRAGRQGDPGDSRFFVSLEDDLMRIFGGEQISNLMTFFHFPEDQPISHPVVSKAIEQAQIKVEGFNFDIRKHLVEFDDVLNKQRHIIYTRRRRILFEKKSENIRELILGIFKESINAIVNRFFVVYQEKNIQDFNSFFNEINMIFPVEEREIKNFIINNQEKLLIDFLIKKVANFYNNYEKTVGSEIWLNIVKSILISTIDYYWTKHLTAIEDLREGINLRGYAQIDPLVAYKNEAFSMFEKLLFDIDFDFLRRLFKIEININLNNENLENLKQRQEPIIFKSVSSISSFKTKNQINFQQEASNSKFSVKKKHKLGRNDPCWCGSGKKYKKCHWPN